MSPFKSSLPRRLLLLAVAVGAIAVAGVLFLRSQFQISSSQNNANGIEFQGDQDLTATLTRLESGIKSGLNSEQMQACADQIQGELQKHPLPDDDDTQFCAELIVRYARELARIEAYRRTTLKKTGYDPLDPQGPRPNPQAIALKKEYSTSLPARTKQLRETLSQLSQKNQAGKLLDVR